MRSRKASIADFIASYFKSRPEVVAVYLFGSYAQGLEKAYSDIDLGILLDHKAFVQKDDLTTTYTVELSKQLRKDFHIIIMNAAGEMLLFIQPPNGHSELYRYCRS